MRIDLSEKSVSLAFPKIQKYNHRKVGEYMHDAYPENFFSFAVDAGARGIVHPWHVPPHIVPVPRCCNNCSGKERDNR